MTKQIWDVFSVSQVHSQVVELFRVQPVLKRNKETRLRALPEQSHKAIVLLCAPGALTPLHMLSVLCVRLVHSTTRAGKSLVRDAPRVHSKDHVVRRVVISARKARLALQMAPLYANCAVQGRGV